MADSITRLENSQNELAAEANSKPVEKMTKQETLKEAIRIKKVEYINGLHDGLLRNFMMLSEKIDDALVAFSMDSTAISNILKDYSQKIRSGIQTIDDADLNGMISDSRARSSQATRIENDIIDDLIKSIDDAVDSAAAPRLPAAAPILPVSTAAAAAAAVIAPVPNKVAAMEAQ